MASALIARARWHMAGLCYRADMRAGRSLERLSECRLRQDRIGERHNLLDFLGHDHVSSVLNTELRTQYQELCATRAD